MKSIQQAFKSAEWLQSTTLSLKALYEVITI